MDALRPRMFLSSLGEEWHILGPLLWEQTEAKSKGRESGALERQLLQPSHERDRSAINQQEPELASDSESICSKDRQYGYLCRREALDSELFPPAPPLWISPLNCLSFNVSLSRFIVPVNRDGLSFSSLHPRTLRSNALAKQSSLSFRSVQHCWARSENRF